MSQKEEDMQEMDDKRVVTILERMCAESAKQTSELKKQLRITRFLALFCALLAVGTLWICSRLLPQLTEVLTRANGVLSEAQTTVQNINDANIPALLDNVDALIAQSQQGITDSLEDVHGALTNLNNIDINSLNQAIADLANIVRPLAGLLG